MSLLQEWQIRKLREQRECEVARSVGMDLDELRTLLRALYLYNLRYLSGRGRVQ